MVYHVLTNLTILFHFLWILFIVFGLFLVWKWPKMAFVHLGGLLFSLIINLFGWYCPLTYLENYLNASVVKGTGYGNSFITRYLAPIVYPDLPENVIRISEIFFVVVLLFVYGALARKHLMRRHFSRD